MIVDECLLQHGELVAVGEAFHGANFLALRLHREHQAGPHRLVIDNNGAGTANAVLAADVGTGLAAIVPDRIDQRFACLDPDRIILPVDIEGDLEFFVGI